MSSITAILQNYMLHVSRLRLELNTVLVLLQKLGSRCGCEAVGSKNDSNNQNVVRDNSDSSERNARY